jgi:hypothetical protein
MRRTLTNFLYSKHVSNIPAAAADRFAGCLSLVHVKLDAIKWSGQSSFRTRSRLPAWQTYLAGEDLSGHATAAVDDRGCRVHSY